MKVWITEAGGMMVTSAESWSPDTMRTLPQADHDPSDLQFNGAEATDTGLGARSTI